MIAIPGLKLTAQETKDGSAIAGRGKLILNIPTTSEKESKQACESDDNEDDGTTNTSSSESESETDEVKDT